MAVTLEHELAELTSLMESQDLLAIIVDDGFFVECSEHEGCRSI